MRFSLYLSRAWGARCGKQSLDLAQHDRNEPSVRNPLIRQQLWRRTTEVPSPAVHRGEEPLPSQRRELPVRHSPTAGWSCRRVAAPPGPPPVWPAGTRAAASVSGHGCWGPSPCRSGREAVRETADPYVIRMCRSLLWKFFWSGWKPPKAACLCLCFFTPKCLAGVILICVQVI